MAILNELVTQIENPDLRARIAAEVEKLAKQKKFGLVFEEHLPECTPLWDIPVKTGCKVALKTGQVSDFYTVLKIEDGKASCLNKDKSATAEFDVDELVTVAEFGEPIYPYLKPIDKVCNAPDNDLWHTLIEADNYHALQLLEYLYAGKVDCIYIDPPYNTGARDWKYNNDYVDNNDQYRHSKWLSMMQKRLKLARKLLNREDSVLIVTIDEKEYLHLGCLLEEMFPEATIQMITSCINPNGAARNKIFTRVDEYIFFVMFGECGPILTERNMLDKEVQSTENVLWFSLIRTGSNSLRHHSENCFYPIFIDRATGRINSVGSPLGRGVNRDSIVAPDGCDIVWPLHGNGDEGVWQLGLDELTKRIEIGAIRVNKKKGKFVLTYLRQGQLKEIEDGYISVVRREEDGTMVLKRVSNQMVQARTMWNQASHDATTFGSKFIKQILCESGAFKYPKSLYAVQDTLYFFVANKPNALVVDFFAGSGTTLHAVNLLNAEDNGHRRCILVTNNEVSDAEAKDMTKRGLKPGDDEWERLGIARYVTWPRTVCSIEGHDVNGNPLKGNYLGSDRPMADGFKANAAYFKLGFLDKNAVALGRQFKEMLPTLWMKAGAHGVCPTVGEETPDMLILPENRFAVLVDEKQYMDFAEKIEGQPEIETVYIITDSESGYRDMINGLNVKESYQLYRDYLDNFRINSVRR